MKMVRYVLTHKVGLAGPQLQQQLVQHVMPPRLVPEQPVNARPAAALVCRASARSNEPRASTQFHLARSFHESHERLGALCAPV